LSITPVVGKPEELETSFNRVFDPDTRRLAGFSEEDTTGEKGKLDDQACTLIHSARAAVNILRIRYSFLNKDDLMALEMNNNLAQTKHG
jgi:hypothetical protein